MKKTLLFLSAFTCAISSTNAQNCADLFISEYVEGYSTNTALEIYNPTANTINLSNYIVARASNGTSIDAIQKKYAVQLIGTIAPYSTYVGACDLRLPGTGTSSPIWDSLEARADGFYSPDYDLNSTFYWNGNDAILLLKGTLSGTNTTALVDMSPALEVVDIFGKIGEDPGVSLGWTSLPPYVNSGESVTVLHSLIRKSTVRKGVTDDAIPYFNPLGEYDSIPYEVHLLDANGDTIRNNDLSPKRFGNWFSLGSHDCECDPASSVANEKLNEEISIYPNPSTSVFHIKGISEYSEIEVLNSLGQKIQDVDVKSLAFITIDLNNVKGVYLIRLTSNTGKKVTKRVIVK